MNRPWVLHSQRVIGVPRYAFLRRLVFALALPVALAMLWFSITSARVLRVDVGAWGDHSYLSGINAVEQSSTESYRWTKQRAEFHMPNLGPAYRALEFRAHGWRPEGTALPQLTLDWAGASLGMFPMSATNRVYHVLLPSNSVRPNVRVGLSTPHYTPPGDQREIGVALDWIGLRAVDQVRAPSLGQFGGQLSLIALALLLVWRLGLPSPWAASVAAILVVLPIAANFVDPLWVSAALPGWLLILAALLGASVLIAPRLSRHVSAWLAPVQAKIAWALLVAALLVRLLGAVHPLFDMHDLPYHTDWMSTAARGELYIYSTPSEFQNRPTFNPPAGYVLLMPFALLLDPRLAVQVGVALLDGMGCLLLLLIARELGIAQRAALLALAVALALPISMTMLWWGFATNALAQPVWLLLVWLLLRFHAAPSLRLSVLVAATAVLAVLTHVGALALIAAALGMLVLLMWRSMTSASRVLLAAGLGAAAVFAAVMYFSAVAPVVIAGRVSTQVVVAASDAANQTALSDRWWLFGRGLMLGFTPVGAALAPFGFVALVRKHGPGAALALAWFAAAAAAVVAYFTLGLVVRDLYFLAPLVCLSLGIALDALWRRGGRLVALVVVALITWQGLALWFGGVLMRIKPSGVPLTR